MDSTNESPGSSSRRRRKNRGTANEKRDKGKERVIRVSRNDERKDLGLNSGTSEADINEDDIEIVAGIINLNSTVSRDALEGLLKKVGAGFDDLPPSSAVASTPPFKQSLLLRRVSLGLRANGEETRQIEALTRLCNLLSRRMKELLSTYSVDLFVPLLVGLLNHESDPEIRLLAAKAISHFCDALPSSCESVVRYGAVSCFCARLHTIDHMDLALESLHALKKISHEHPSACLRACALVAVLSHLDFFSTGVQGVALCTAENICKKLPEDSADYVMEAVPLLVNLLQHHDAKVLEHASVCLTLISEAFASSSDKLDELCNHGIIAHTASLISSTRSATGHTSLSVSTFKALIRLLSTLANGSVCAAVSLLYLGISGILKDILLGPEPVLGTCVSPSLSKPPDQIFDIVNLTSELLPPLPKWPIMAFPTTSNTSAASGSSLKKSSSRSSSDAANGSVTEPSVREKQLKDHPELMKQFGMDILPVLIQIYGLTTRAVICHKCLLVMVKWLYFSTVDMMQSLLTVTNLSSFLAGVLRSEDPDELIPAVRMAEILMDRFPSTFSGMFMREGVFHAMDALSSLTNSSSTDPTPAQSPSLISLLSSLETISPNTDSQQSSDPTEIPRHNLVLLASIRSQAKSFKDKHFPSETAATDRATRLRTLSLELNNARLNSEETQAETLSNDILEELNRGEGEGDGISMFEFISSGVIDSLLNHFSTPGRFKRSVNPRVTVLVRKLQTALSSFEQFPVLLSWGSASDHRALSQPIKLRLCRDVEETSLQDYPSSVVSVGPLSKVSSLEDLIWARVQPADPSVREKGKAVAKTRCTRTRRSNDEEPTSGSTGPPRLVFAVHGKQLNPDLTVFLAVRQHDRSPTSSTVHTLTYRTPVSDATRARHGGCGFRLSRVLALLHVLRRAGSLKAAQFVNEKLTSKLTRQMQDTLVLCTGEVPSWCDPLVKLCPFLFPFETRRQYFYSTAFGLTRALVRLHERCASGGVISVGGTACGLDRKRVRVDRDRAMDSCFSVMEKHGEDTVIDAEFEGEVATGLGPTLEFYTILSRDFQNPSLGIWRPGGGPLLFPRPIPPSDSADSVVGHFRLLGWVVAKALQDGRLLDIPLSPAFYKLLVLQQELGLEDISSFDPELGRSLVELRRVTGDGDVISIEDLCLDFTLPGYPDYALDSGDKKNVTMWNLDEYVAAVVDATVSSGIRRQMEAFHAGFGRVFNICKLKIFYPDELDRLLCGQKDPWEPESLADHVTCDHGYTATSAAVINLLEIMGEFTGEQQRAFCQFVTGAPRLPLGGLAALKPRLTVVRKHSSKVSGSVGVDGLECVDDDNLPSVMTCTNYLKLPQYSTKDMMRRRLLFAIEEGQGCFEFS